MCGREREGVQRVKESLCEREKERRVQRVRDSVCGREGGYTKQEIVCV